MVLIPPPPWPTVYLPIKPISYYSSLYSPHSRHIFLPLLFLEHNKLSCTSGHCTHFLPSAKNGILPELYLAFSRTSSDSYWNPSSRSSCSTPLHKIELSLRVTVYFSPDFFLITLSVTSKICHLYSLTSFAVIAPDYNISFVKAGTLSYSLQNPQSVVYRRYFGQCFSDEWMFG